MQTECRYTATEFEVRSANGKTVIQGYASIFDKLSENLGGFVERVAPGTFTKTIQEADVRALFNHDPMYVLGRTTAGTLHLLQDSTGLEYRVDMPDTTFARDLSILMERGDVKESSFKFKKIQDEWGFTERKIPMRTLQEVALLDVSPVTYPAYPDATANVAARSALMGLAEMRGLSLEQVEEDISAAILGEIETRSESETSEPDHSTLTTGNLSVYRAQLAVRKFAPLRSRA